MSESWARSLVRVPQAYRAGGVSLHELFKPYGVRLRTEGFALALREALREDPELVDAWRMYSGDKRTSPSPYFGREGDELEVGFYAEGYHDVVDHSDEVEACADFIRREAAWVLQHRRVK